MRLHLLLPVQYRLQNYRLRWGRGWYNLTVGHTHFLQIDELRAQLRQETEIVAKQRETVQALKQDVALHKTNSEELERRRQNDEAARVSINKRSSQFNKCLLSTPKWHALLFKKSPMVEVP